MIPTFWSEKISKDFGRKMISTFWSLATQPNQWYADPKKFLLAPVCELSIKHINFVVSRQIQYKGACTLQNIFTQIVGEP